MGLFDQVVGALGAGSAGGADSTGNLLQTVMQFVNNPQTGGLPGLIERFQQGGLGEVVNSWVSTGQNLPISAEHIQAVLGGSGLQELIAKLGVTPAQATGSLAQVLPQVVDTLTPNGQLPAGGDMLAQGMDLLKKGGFFS